MDQEDGAGHHAKNRGAERELFQHRNPAHPHAPVESFNVFDPLPNPSMGTWGKLGNEQGTHDERFDSVPVDANGNPIHGSDQAAVHATAEMLESYEKHREESMAQANA